MARLNFLVVILTICLFIWGFSQPNPDLRQYRRTPLRVKLAKLLESGKDLYFRRKYEEALAVFEAMDHLDPRNLTSLYWKEKCDEKLFQEKNEKVKSAIIKKNGSLKPKESGFENVVWGPTVGHFEIRISKPKPYIVPPKKIRLRASDEELEKANEAAAKGDAEAQFELAMLHKSRGEIEAAFAALEKAAQNDPEIMANDDEGLTSGIIEENDKAIEKGTITPEQRIMAARVAFLQGDWPEAIIQLIKGASKDESLKEKAKTSLKKVIDSGRTHFLQRPPDVSAIYQAYVYEDNEDRVYLWSEFSPTSPLYVFPFDLEFEQGAIKSIEIKSPDILFAFVDPFIIDSTRLWIVGKDPDDKVTSLNLKIIIHLDPGTPEIKLSNFWVESTLPGNWSIVFGLPDSFHPGFPTPRLEKDENGITMKAFQLIDTSGKGPSLILPDFRKPLPQKVDVWKTIEDIHAGTI